MGDFASPKRREVFDRVRRRYELLRRHQNGSLRRFENTINGLYEQQRQDTVLLQQRWLESRAKKSSKQSKSSKDSNSGHGGDSRNLSIVTQRLKKKIDNNQVENPPVDTSAFDFDDSDTTTTNKKSVNTNPPGVDVSINIVQQIRGVNSQQEPKIQTNVNVSTTVKTHYTSGSAPETSSSQTSTNVETRTSVECKQEPGIDDTQCGGSNQSENSQNSSDILNQDELEDILNTIGNGNDEISDELYEELKRFDQIYSKVLQEDSNDSQDKMFNTGMTSTSPGLQKHAPSAPFPEHSPDNINNVYDGNQNINPIRTPPMHPYRSPPNPAGVTMSETGPAAETLKQMAAQHQSQQHDIGYGMKSMDPYTRVADVQGAQYSNRQTNNGYPNSYDHQHYLSQGAYLGQQSQNMNNLRNAQVQYSQTKSPEIGLNYGATKPLTHYPTPSQQPPPSSLQQLQNQVQAHFNQGPQMEITQTQHMQVSDGTHRSMQMSQTQQLQMRQPHPQIAMSQQQSFSMGPSSQYMDEQMKMEMMEKMRRETLRKQQAQHQQQQAADAQSQAARAAHMQQYMNRPPPEYKMQQSAGQTSQEGYSSNGVGTNPLQPMQNMVNQTNTLQNSGYGQIKTESGSVQMQNGMMQSAQMTSMQRMTSSGQTAGLTRQASASQASSTTYTGQAMQRQQSYPGAQPSVQEARQPRPSGPNFTSAIMRNQRPPNVNVGPEGLNISQPRTQHDWPRQMGPRHGVPAGMNQPPMSAAGMMQYSSYNQVGNMNAVQAGMQMRQTRPMQMSAMQSQAAMMQGNPQAQQMMMQQNMQMSQRMNIRGPMPGNASGSMAPTMDANSSGYSSPPVVPHQDDFMNLLDSAPGGNSEFIDGISVQSSDPNNDANWLDEILGGK